MTLPFMENACVVERLPCTCVHFWSLDVAGLTGCANRQDDYVPPKRPYSFLAMLDDILQFAADHLVPGGRLCFWMPTANEDFSQLDIPTHPELEIVSVCVQEFNKCTPALSGVHCGS